MFPCKTKQKMIKIQMRIIIFVVVFLHRITLSFFFFVVVVVLNIAYILNESKKWHFVFKEVLDYITHTLQHGWIWKQLFFLRINQFYFYQKKTKHIHKHNLQRNYTRGLVNDSFSPGLVYQLVIYNIQFYGILLQNF